MYADNSFWEFTSEMISWWNNEQFHLPAGTLHAIIFMVVQPLLIVLFAATTAIAAKSSDEKLKKVLRKIALVSVPLMAVLAVLLCIITLFLVGLTAER